MIYCAINEAFDNSLKKQICDYEERTNNYKKSLQEDFEHNNFIQGSFDNYSDIDIHKKEMPLHNNLIQHPNIYPAFFTAQGDYSSKGPYFGTSINDLKKNNDNINEFDSLLFTESPETIESVFSDEFSIKKKKNEKILDHSYYINKFIKNLTDEYDSVSLESSNNDAIFSHVKNCKFCKGKVNEKLKLHFNPKPKNDIKLNKINEYFSNQSLGYNLKELFIIILGGIVLVFILDLLVKIGKKMNR